MQEKEINKYNKGDKKLLDTNNNRKYNRTHEVHLQIIKTTYYKIQ